MYVAIKVYCRHKNIIILISAYFQAVCFFPVFQKFFIVYFSSQIFLFSCTLFGHIVQMTEYRYVENVGNTWHKPIEVHQEI